MKRILLSTLIVALVAGPVGLAQADIVKCTDKDGHVTLTDMPCDNPTLVVRTDETGSPVPEGDADWSQNSDQAPQSDTRVVDGVTRITLSPDEFGPRSRRAAYARMERPAPNRIFAIDAATLRAAHDTLALLDAEPRQRLASH
ncbi:MAG TPA: hypothetical protein VFT37_12725 [Telluria sp.]|nr:hypothetical protein [Telluria sp.]